MTIALGGSSGAQPTSQYKVQFNGTQLPGYCSAVDDPLTNQVSSRKLVGRAGGPVSNNGSEARDVQLSMFVLSRLRAGAGRAHLDDCMEQVREALAILDRAGGSANLYIGDSDRHLEATFAGYSSPLAAPDNRKVTYNIRFIADPPYYIADTAVSNYRNLISDARLSGTTTGSPTYVAGRFNQGLLSDANGEYVSLAPSGSLNTTAGSLALWAKPYQWASTNNTTTYTLARLSGSSNHVDLQWDHTVQRFVLKGAGGAGSVTYATLPALTFASNSNIFLAASWDNTGTRLYGGVAADTLQSGSSATSLLTNTGAPSIFYVGGHGAAQSRSVLSDLLTFRSALTGDQAAALYESSSAYDPLSTDLPTTMLLDHRFNGTAQAHSNSNGIWLDLPDTREVYPSVTIIGGSAIHLSGSNTGKAINYTAAPGAGVTVDCGALTALDANGGNVIVNVSGVNFGIAYDGNERVGLETLSVSGTVTSVTMAVTPLYER